MERGDLTQVEWSSMRCAATAVCYFVTWQATVLSLLKPGLGGVEQSKHLQTACQADSGTIH